MSETLQDTLFDLESYVRDDYENPKYLTEQIITYIGNKRSLLGFIAKGINTVKKRLNKNKLTCFDVFAGSGVVSRALKSHSSILYSNDLEDYVNVINSCYLANRSEVNFSGLTYYYKLLRTQIRKSMAPGFITEMYSPKDEANIQPGERVFYTRRNAMYIDTARRLIEDVPHHMKNFFIAPLLYEASVHNNTSGVFKGFYKNKEGIGQFGGTGRNALVRILGEIELKLPIFSRFESEYHLLQMNARDAVNAVPEIDLAYMDPPYNQHPYGSNYFMLNLITSYIPPISYSNVSGIPNDWKRSAFNKAAHAQEELFYVISQCPAKFILISYNSEGFVQYDSFMRTLQKLGQVDFLETDYNTFRGCRNLKNRDIRVKEYLFLLEKK